MCSDPQTKRFGATEIVHACRVCNQCIATRKHEYVARAMMEKATSAHSIVLALTYNDETQENRDAARFFDYSTVRRFVHRLNSACRKLGHGNVRFIAAGEQGDRNKRCHWHVVLFSDVDLTTIGKFHAVKNGQKVLVMRRKDIISAGSKAVRLDWTQWPHGLVTIQEHDFGGMCYALSYALKDQFTIEKSEDTRRVNSAENFATGVFRMSKHPPIGWKYLNEKLDALEQSHSINPNLNFHIPEMQGYYHPSGATRKMILSRFAAITWATRAKLGRNPAQFSSLMAALTKPDERVQFYVKKVFEKTDTQRAALGFFDQQRTTSEAEYVARNCGGSLPCFECFRAAPSIAFKYGFEAFTRETTSGIEVDYFDKSRASLAQKTRFVGRCNADCSIKESRSAEGSLAKAPD